LISLKVLKQRIYKQYIKNTYNVHKEYEEEINVHKEYEEEIRKECYWNLGSVFKDSVHVNFLCQISLKCPKLPLGFNIFIDKYFISTQLFLDVSYIYNDYKFGGHTNK